MGRIFEDSIRSLVSESNVHTQTYAILPRLGPLAQLVEHLVCNEGVAGSNPVRSTNPKNPSNEALEFVDQT